MIMLRGYADQGTTTRQWGGGAVVASLLAGILGYVAGGTKTAAVAGLGVLGAGLVTAAVVYHSKASTLRLCTEAAARGTSLPQGQNGVIVDGAVLCADDGGLTYLDLDKAMWAAGGIGAVSLFASAYFWRRKKR